MADNLKDKKQIRIQELENKILDLKAEIENKELFGCGFDPPHWYDGLGEELMRAEYELADLKGESRYTYEIQTESIPDHSEETLQF